MLIQLKQIPGIHQFYTINSSTQLTKQMTSRQLIRLIHEKEVLEERMQWKKYVVQKLNGGGSELSGDALKM